MTKGGGTVQIRKEASYTIQLEIYLTMSLFYKEWYLLDLEEFGARPYFTFSVQFISKRSNTVSEDITLVF